MEVCKLHFYPDGNEGRVACMVPASAEVHDINGAMCFSMGESSMGSAGGSQAMMCVNSDRYGDVETDILNVCGPGMVLAMSTEGTIMCAKKPEGNGAADEEVAEQEDDDDEEVAEQEDDDDDELEDDDYELAEQEEAEGSRAGKTAAAGDLVCYMYKAEDLTQCYGPQFMVPKDRLQELNKSLIVHKGEDNRVAICTLDEVSKKLVMCVGLDFAEKTPYDMSSLCGADAIPILRRDGAIDCKLPSEIHMADQEMEAEQVEDEMEAEQVEDEMEAEAEVEQKPESSLELHEAVMPEPLPATSHTMPLPPYLPPHKNYAYALNTMTYSSSEPDLASVYINRIQSM